MCFDFLTVEGRITYRIVTSYSNYRASGWSRDKAYDEIREDLKQLPHKDQNDKKIKEKMATYEEIERVVDEASRQQCPENLEKKLIGLSPSLYSNRNLRRRISMEFYNDIDFPLFGEETYERIERETQGKLRNQHRIRTCS